VTALEDVSEPAIGRGAKEASVAFREVTMIELKEVLRQPGVRCMTDLPKNKVVFRESCHRRSISLPPARTPRWPVG
jgi:hypothetical protein